MLVKTVKATGKYLGLCLCWHWPVVFTVITLKRAIPVDTAVKISSNNKLEVKESMDWVGIEPTTFRLLSKYPNH